MKTLTGKKSAFGTLACLLAACFFIAGCVVTSVYPFYSDKDLVFESPLLGDWTSADGDAKSGEFMRLSRLGEDKKGYLATAFTAESTNSRIIHLFRLNQQLFLDSCPTNDSVDHVPVHQLSKVTRLQPELETAELSYKWLDELLKQNPKAIRHVRVQEKPDQDAEDRRIVLTADTAELQKFVLKHLNNTNAWNAPDRARRPKQVN